MPDQNLILEYVTPNRRHWPWYRDTLFALAVAMLAWSIIDPMITSAKTTAQPAIRTGPNPESLILDVGNP